jgi:hypothetical protein
MATKYSAKYHQPSYGPMNRNLRNRQYGPSAMRGLRGMGQFSNTDPPSQAPSQAPSVPASQQAAPSAGGGYGISYANNPASGTGTVLAGPAGSPLSQTPLSQTAGVGQPALSQGGTTPQYNPPVTPAPGTPAAPGAPATPPAANPTPANTSMTTTEYALIAGAALLAILAIRKKMGPRGARGARGAARRKR